MKVLAMQGRYVIEQPIATGAQSQVFRAYDQVLHKACVLKTGDFVEKEAFLALELNHPYICKPYDFGNSGSMGTYAAYPLLSSPCLKQQHPDLRKAALQIAEFLSYLHHSGWIYNDFKGDHFYLAEDGLQVIDLGLCARLNQSGQAQSLTYCGTFPFISPERLEGRPFDGRSDLFAFGILLLSLLLPDERLPTEPSLEALFLLQKKSVRLKGFWKEIIQQLIAWEPSQRIGSAQDLWTKLLPPSASKSFLFFPLKDTVSVPHLSFDQEQVLFIESPSEISLNEIENQALLNAWKCGRRTLVFDFRFVDVETSVAQLCKHLLNNVPADVYVAAESIQEAFLTGELLVVYKSCESLDEKQKSFLAFVISSLSKSCFLRILVISSAPWTIISDERWKIVKVFANTPLQLDKVLHCASPEGQSAKLLQTLKNKSFDFPEEVVLALRSELPCEAVSCWPSAARAVLTPASSRLSLLEKRLVAAVAIAGGTIKTARLLVLCRGKKSLTDALEKLITLGCLKRFGDALFLKVSQAVNLDVLRPQQIRELSKSLLSTWPILEDPERRFAVTVRAKENRAAALQALLLARNYRGHSCRDYTKWLWNAFANSARIPKLELFRMAKYFLKNGEAKKALKVISQIRSRYGLSFRLGSLYLELYLRLHRVDTGVRLATKLERIASDRHKKYAQSFFKLKHAGFLIHQSKLDEGETILSEFISSSVVLAPVLHGLKDHFLGLLYFYRGNFSAAYKAFENAKKYRHPLWSSSVMNLGIVLGRLGKYERAEEVLRTSLLLFAKVHDSDGLAHAYSNLGILLKQKGRLSEARKCYYQSIQLSMAGGNKKVAVMGLINVANALAIEGLPTSAIHYLKKAFRISRTGRLKIWAAFAQNNLGLQYAVLGKFKLAISMLNRAIRERKKLGLKADFAASLENLGVVFLLSSKLVESSNHLERAAAVFKDFGSTEDLCRINLYLTINKIQKGLIAEARELLSTVDEPKGISFERALYYYTCASLQVATPDFIRLACRDSIHEAEVLFRKLPSLFWLAKTFKLKSRYLYRIDQPQKALRMLGAAHEMFMRLNARRELFDLGKGGAYMEVSETLLSKMSETLPYKVLQMIREVLFEKDPEKMISRILEVALDFTDMERAVLILQEESPRIFKSTSIDDRTIRDICEISQSAARTASRMRPLVCLDVASDSSLSQRPSVLANHIMSIVCLPLQEGDRLIGYLYLDSREGVETLASMEKMLLEIFSSVIALALSTTMLLSKSIKENDELKASLGLKKDFPQIIGTSRAVSEMLPSLQRLVDLDLPVLITGETGTGKELIARILHFSGRRRSGPFVAINCSALTETLLESELFGHEKGAFTGAATTRKGLFEEAKNGTLLLDEIGDMPYAMQTRFLRVLQDGEFRRVGGNQILHTNARIVLATNRNLPELVKERQFREDLYYRIKVAQVHLPPLRERQEDVLLLASHFLKSASGVTGKKIRGFSKDALALMKSYSWPGNVRQLKNEIERVVAFAETDWIRAIDFDPQIVQAAGRECIQKQPQDTLREMEKSFILERLNAHEWNILHAARSLGLTRNGLYSKMRIHHITRQ
ncbi:sigma 54-interacting transcriptional regulator [bacterium]|nr:sigma 54-interacting transcriptional regulator [bacterium]